MRDHWRNRSTLATYHIRLNSLLHGKDMASPFIEELRADMRLRGYSLKTEKSYLGWIRQFIFFHHKRHPKDMGATEVRDFLSWLANERHVAINTQKQARYRP